MVLSSLSPSIAAEQRNLAFVVLTRSLLPDGDPSQSTETLGPSSSQASSPLSLRDISATISDWLSSSSSDSEGLRDLGNAFTSLETVFSISVPKGLEILSVPGIPDKIVESVTTHSIASDFAKLGTVSNGKRPVHEGEHGADVDLAIASFLSSVIGSKQPRELLLSQWPGSSDYLINLFSAKEDGSMSEAARCTASVALAKLHLAPPPTDAAGQPAASTARTLPSVEKIAEALKRALQSTASVEVQRPAVEGLALLSLQPSIRRLLVPPSSSASDLKPLINTLATLSKPSLASSESLTLPTDFALAYSIATLIGNLTARKRPTSGAGDEAATEKLRRMMAAKAPKGAGGKTAEEEEEDAKYVDGRCTVLVKAGVMQVVAQLAKSKSEQTRRGLGKVLLDLVEKAEDRGKILSGGAIGALMAIIDAMRPTGADGKKPASSVALDPADLPALQALAKLLITNNPLLILGPSPSSPLTLSVLAPLLALLLHPSASLLQTFEALMALTNLSSLGPETADRIAKNSAALAKIETCMLEEHRLVRRAATELVCNLAGNSPTGWERYTGETADGSGPGSVEGQKKLKAAAGRLHLLAALGSTEDGPTRLASFGALATVTASPLACLAIMTHDKTAKLIVDLVAEPEEDEGMAHRMTEVLKNLAMFGKESGSRDVLDKVKAAGVEQALRQVAARTDTGDIVKQTAQQGLQCFQ